VSPQGVYFKGHGKTVLATMRKHYGKKRGTRVFYGTINNMRKGTPNQRAAQPKRAPGAKRR
jgi:hypothetical protein